MPHMRASFVHSLHFHNKFGAKGEWAKQTILPVIPLFVGH